MVLKALAGGFSFAHFAGLGRSSKKGAAAEDLRDQHDEEAVASAAAAETEECEEDAEEEEGAAAADGKKGGKKSGKKDDEDDGETSDGEDDGDDEDEDEDEEASEEGKGKGKKAAAPAAPKAGAKASAKSGSSDFKRGKKAERRRIGLILSNKAASANLAFACKLACNTGMSSSAAIALLEQTPAAAAQRGGRLDRAMSDAKVPEVKAGGPDEPKGSAAIQASWGEAFKGL